MPSMIHSFRYQLLIRIHIKHQMRRPGDIPWPPAFERDNVMKKQILALALALSMALGLLTGCGNSPATTPDASVEPSVSDTSAGDTSTNSQVATSSEMTTVENVVEEGMVPVYGSDINDGTYSVTVDSSSSMFSIVDCQLTVENGEMTAVMTMSSTGYLYLYMGTGEEAVAAEESAYIPYVENEEGAHTFTVPVEALDEGIPCAAFSKRKEKWYDRTLLFRADSLPLEALSEGVITTPESLNLADGVYTVEVMLEGGSGRASVESPAKLTVENGSCTAEIVWSSSNYDCMVIDDDMVFEPVNSEGNSTFEIPVSAFDYPMPVQAETTAMSQPHMIDYTLYFDSTSLQAQE